MLTDKVDFLADAKDVPTDAILVVSVAGNDLKSIILTPKKNPALENGQGLNSYEGKSNTISIKTVSQE